MGHNTPTRSSEQFPLVPAVILFVVFGLALAMMLAGQPRIAPAVRPTVTIRPSATPIVPTEVAALPTEEAAPAEGGEAQTVAYDPARVAAGETLFMATCSACHGMNARGIQGLGKDVLDSPFMDSLTDEELHNFIVVGRAPTDPLNTTGVQMPPYGGNPTLTDQNLYDIIAYLRVNALHPERIVANGGAGTGESAVEPAEPAEPVATSTPLPAFVLPADRLRTQQAALTPTEPFVLPADRLRTQQAATPTPGQ